MICVRCRSTRDFTQLVINRVCLCEIVRILLLFLPNESLTNNKILETFSLINLQRSALTKSGAEHISFERTKWARQFVSQNPYKLSLSFFLRAPYFSGQEFKPLELKTQAGFYPATRDFLLLPLMKVRTGEA